METFSNLLRRYYEFKKQHSPYDYREWRVGGEIVKECKSILDQIAEHIKGVLIQKGGLREGEFTVTSASGTGYYPKSPWVGVFKKGECATDGVYPVLGFYNDSEGCFIGCAESFTNPQFGFQREYCSNNECSSEDRKLLEDTGLDDDRHLARMPKTFVASSEISEDCLLGALKSALDIYEKYRASHPRLSPTAAVCRANDVVSTPTWYKEIRVDDVGKWVGFISTGISSKESERWIFRGHGDAKWHLVSYLERSCGSIRDGKTIYEIEQNSIRHFVREAHAFPSWQRLNGVNILAMMQHYGSATRLLDFTYAPLIALFFAIDQYKTIRSYKMSRMENQVRNNFEADSKTVEKMDKESALAVWAINLKSILDESANSNLNESLAISTKEAHKIILHSASGIRTGVNVVLPKFGNERLSAQSGLFLMARNLGNSFEENLSAALQPTLRNFEETDFKCENISAITDWNRIVQKFGVLKFVFPAVKVDELDAMLKSLCITYKTVYPDLMGIAKDATENL